MTFNSPDRNWTRSKFGSEIKAYALYQNIDLRLSQEAVDRSMKKLFGLPVALGTTNNFKEEAAEKYQITYNALIKGLTSICKHATGCLHLQRNARRDHS